MKGKLRNVSDEEVDKIVERVMVALKDFKLDHIMRGKEEIKEKKKVEMKARNLDLSLFEFEAYEDIKTRYRNEFSIFCSEEVKSIGQMCSKFRFRYKLC